MPFPILKFRPFVRPMPWGGDALKRLFGKNLSSGEKIGETWEIADRPEGASLVAEGPLSGKTLTDLHREDPAGLTGLASPPARFPLLVKFLDAADWLSLQVHPDATAAKKTGAESKTECWVITEARPDAFLYLGLAPGKGSGDLEKALAEGHPEAVLNKVRISTGDFLFVPAGTVHAIGPGIVLAEIQQNSDTTYRLSDWGRADPSGRPRALHVAQGLSCITNDPCAGKICPFAATHGAASTANLVTCPAFTLERITLTGAHAPAASPVVQCLGFLSGEGVLRAGGGESRFAPGDWFLVPPRAPVEIAPRERAVFLSALPGN